MRPAAFAFLLVLVLVSPALAQNAPLPPTGAAAGSGQDASYVPTPAEEGKPILRLRVQDVGRLALRNSPPMSGIRRSIGTPLLSLVTVLRINPPMNTV